MENLVILGSGPAGLTAALYAARAELSPLVITGSQLGGQIAITNIVENYPGFPQGTTGPELAQLMQEQAERFGARLELDDAESVDLQRRPFRVRTGAGEEYETRALIVATGATPRKLGVTGEESFTGSGVSYCATCDGYFFRGKDVVVVGGGDSAMEEGLFLTRYAGRIRVLHRRDQLRASPILRKRALESDGMEFVWNTVVTGIHGDGEVNSITTRNTASGEQERMDTEGVFIFIGHDPNTQFLRGQLELDEEGYVRTDGKTGTEVEGAFAAGEVADPTFRQIVSSAGMGCQAAMRAQRYLE